MKTMASDEAVLEELKNIRRELTTIRGQLTQVVFSIREAESEIPEKMRRFIMYMHDVHDIVNLYHEGGQPAPDHVLREMERCDDRYRQLLKELHTDGGAFEKVRRDMAKDPENRWDHTRQLSAPKETK
jgi:hypothetical protein